MERPRANGRCGLSEMQSSDGQAPGGRGDRHVAPRSMRYGWSTLDGASGPLPLAAPEHAALRAPEPPHGRAHALSANVPIEGRTAFELPKDKTIAISIIAGPSKGITHQIHKPRISIGGAGGGADIEIDDPKLSRLHCTLGVSHGAIRLCDLNSTNGTYVNDELVQAAELGHLSEFRVGSSRLLVTIIAKRGMDHA
jgi:hypothetical protein